MKKILLILGHPRAQSLCGALAEAYLEGAVQAGAEVRVLRLSELSFDPNYSGTVHGGGGLEPDLQRAQADIRWAEHLVFVYPQWWGGVPALLKGFIDRAFTPGFAFKYQKGSPYPLKLLRGRTARLLVTMDSPGWYNRLVYRSAVHSAMKYPTLELCGVKPVRVSEFNEVRKATPAVVEKWLEQTRQLGAREASSGSSNPSPRSVA